MANKSLEPMPKPVNMTINAEMLQCKLSGIKRIVETGITGNAKKDENGKNVYRVKMKDGKPVEKDGKPVREKVPEFETVNVKYTVDLSDALLSMVVDKAMQSVIIDIARTARKSGEKFTQALDGSVQQFNEVIKTGRVKVPTEVKIYNEADKLTDPEDQERLVRTLIERFNIKL